MRSEKEMFYIILNFAKNDDRIRVVGLEGSRTNINIPKDDFQDYDITYIINDNDMQSFTKNDDWHDVFGKRIIIQKPEDMELFPSESDWFFSYLMLFEDDIKIDLKIVPINFLEKYLKWDKLGLVCKMFFSYFLLDFLLYNEIFLQKKQIYFKYFPHYKAENPV